MNRNLLWTWLTSAAVVTFSGCGADDGNLPKTVPASGIVTLDG